MDRSDFSGRNGGVGRGPSAVHTLPRPVVHMARLIDDLAQRLLWVANITIVLGVGAVAWFALDRDPPFAVLSVDPASAKAGEWVTIRSQVRREVDRNCSADFSRFVFDSGGSRYDLGTSSATAEMIRVMERKSPGVLAITIRLPDGMQAGSADLTTALQYRCNKVHYLWPIEVTTHMPFRVLP